MPEPTSRTVTELLDAIGSGDRTAFDSLLPLVYQELRSLAAAQLRRERPDHTLQPTALVHEAYLKLVGQNRAHYKNRGHFLSVACLAMRRILVDHARLKKAAKRDGRLAFDSFPVVGREDHVLAVDAALERLAAIDPRPARVVELRFFLGLDLEETAAVLDVSVATVKRDWVTARAWLRRDIGDSE